MPAGAGAPRRVLQRQGVLRPAEGAPQGEPARRRARAHRAALSVPEATSTRRCCASTRTRARSCGARKSRRTRAPGTRSAIACRSCAGDARDVLYAGRAPAAAPATGIAKMHEAEQNGAGRRGAARQRQTEDTCRDDSAPHAGHAIEEKLVTIEIRVPQLPESVADATLVAWHKKPGDAVKRDENLVDLETDKVVLEVPAPANGVLEELKVENGTTVTSGQVLAILEEGARRRQLARCREGAPAAAKPARRQRGSCDGRAPPTAARRHGCEQAQPFRATAGRREQARSRRDSRRRPRRPPHEARRRRLPRQASRARAPQRPAAQRAAARAPAPAAPRPRRRAHASSACR